MQQTVVMDDIELLFGLLPSFVRESLDQDRNHELIEIVLDLGRLPEARYSGSFAFLTSSPITRDDIDHVIKRVGHFGGDNRAGIERTLHRISAIMNRTGDVVGLTCRVGRAIFGTINPIRDVVETGKSILLLGRPGVGKTTMLREVARVLSDEFSKRVMIVDTSNEIAGDGDIPHPAIGHSRRMQVMSPDRQAEVMIEAVENHMPEVIIIDEIGTEGEAQAARTIGERGVQLIGTAHGNTLENLVLNPTLSDLIGGIHTVTLGDEEARRRGTQKTVLERKAPPTFDIVIELRSKDEVVIHHDVAAIIDGYLRGDAPVPEIRRREADGEVTVVQKGHIPEAKGSARLGDGEESNADSRWASRDRRQGRRYRGGDSGSAPGWTPDTPKGPIRIFPYGISRDYLERAVVESRAPIEIVKEASEANTVVTLKAQVKKLPARVRDAEHHGASLYIIRSNTQTQVSSLIEGLVGDGRGGSKDVLVEAEVAAKKVLMGDTQAELSPTTPRFRRLQHELAERHGLRSTSVGLEPNRHVVIHKR